MKRNKKLLYLSLIICLGCSLQVLFMFFLMNPYVLEWPDPNDYLAIANSLAKGASYSGNLHNLYRSPGYPFFLYFIISIVGNKLILIRLAHIAFQGVFLLGVYKLGKLWKGDKFGLLLTLVCALYPYYIYIPLTLYPEAILIFISPWIIYLFLRIEKSFTFYHLLAAGALISVAALTRPTYLIISAVFFTYIFFRKNAFINKAKVLGFLIIVPFACVMLWGYHNLKIQHHFVISTAANTNLFMGFNDSATIYTKSDVHTPQNVQSQLVLAKNAFEIDSIYKKSAVEFIKAHPAKSIYLASFRMFDLWNPIPHTSTKIPLYKKIISALPYTIILLFSFFGAYLLRREKFIYMLIGILLFNTIVNGIFAVSIRYRVIFDIIILMFFTFYLDNLMRKYFKGYSFEDGTLKKAGI